jgi:hypothetical protein
MTTQPNSPNPLKLPAPLYALAGAGDLAAAKLRELPTHLAQQVNSARVQAERLTARTGGAYGSLTARTGGAYGSLTARGRQAVALRRARRG